MTEILHVTEAFGAGVATAMGQYAGSFPARHRALVSARPESVAPEITGAFAETVVLPGLRELSAAYPRRSGLPDVVHCHSSKAGVLVRTAARPGRARIVHSPHALAFTGRRWYEPRSWSRLAEVALRGRADAYGAVSAYEAGQLHRLGIPRARIVEVPHHIPVPAPARSPHRDTVVAVGRVCAQKDPAFFAAVAAAARGTGLHFRWIGGGDPELTAMLRAHDVHVTGWQDRTEVLDFLARRAALLVHGARYEGLPIALVEAMSVGVPVVARRIPSLAQLLAVTVVDGPAEAAEAVRTLPGTAERDRLSTAGRDEVRRRYSRDNQRDALARLYGVAA